VNEYRLVQLCIDITDRKKAAAYQSELFDELNHRVRNNLTLISALLHMQGRDAATEVRDELEKAAARVHSIAEVHASLYHGTGGNLVDLGVYLGDLCANLARSLIHEERIAVTVEAQSIVLSVDTAVALGMVVNELVTNAVKYAYPEPAEGVIDVRLARVEGELRLSVSDAGAGLPEDAERRAGSLGMRLVKSLVTQVHGRMSIGGQPGTRFEITFPDPAATIADDRAR
jgi:two-component sensor histidine kinase